MGAKQKLNAANAVGSIVLAALIGGLTGSWPVFVIAAALLLVANYHTGDIRR